MDQEEVISLLKTLQAVSLESEWVEFKVNNSNPQDMGEYISALSNSACYAGRTEGYLVYGIEDKSHIFVGTDFRPRETKVGNEELENWLATQLNPRIDFNILECELVGKRFVIFRIDSARGTPVNFKGEAFIRIGGYKKKLYDHPEKERKIWASGNAHSFEREPARERVSAEEVLRLIDYPNFFDLLNLSLPDNREGIIDRLADENVIIPSGDRYTITNLGALLFAKQIRDFDELSRKAVRVIQYHGTNRIKAFREQVGKRGYAVGFKALIEYIMGLLPTNEIVKTALREQVSLYSPIAVRELVANAIIHQDFSISGTSPMVELFEDRMEITNPGKPLIDILRFVDHSPQSPNESLARLMRRLRICEERGSGIDKVVYECELHRHPAPEFIVGENYTRAIIYAPKPFNRMDKKEKIRSCYLHACLKSVSGDYMTNQSLRNRFGVEEHNYSVISRIIGDTKDAGLVKDYDPENKSRIYAKYLPFWA